MAVKVADNAKTQKYSPCNASEGLLVAQGVAAEFLPLIGKIYAEKGVEMRCCPKAKAILSQVTGANLREASEQDWFEERMATHGSPLDLFGWPKDQLPDLTKIQPHYQPDNDPEWWTKRSPAEFENEFISVGKNFTKAGELHGVSRQRYTEIIKSKCRPSLFE
jgi:hypothetical protein